MPALANIKVLIVDDSIFFRKALEQGLSQDPRIEIVGTAFDSFDAMDKIKKLCPDVVTLDVEMPKLNGIDFLKQLMPVHPVPVVVVSSAPIRVLDALDAGAVDFVRKPEANSAQSLKAFLSELKVKVKIASTAKVRKHAQSLPRTAMPALKSPLLTQNSPVIAIGASTGGTEAILSVVKNLPATTPGIVVVQHMPPVFTKMYAQRLDRLCQMHVVEAVHGDRVEQGQPIIGAGEFHLRLAKDAHGYYVKSEPGEKVSGHCPSVDVLFDSVADVAGKNAMGVLLTGMGADGANSLLKMRKAGAYTVGQDKESCVVYGMPMVAFNIGAVKKQLPLDQIDKEIIRFLNAPDSVRN